MKRLATLLTVLLLVPVSFAQMRQAQRALERGELVEARTMVDEILAEDPEDHRAHDLSARIHKAEAEMSGPESFIAHIEGMVAAYRMVAQMREREAEKIEATLIQLWVEYFNKGISEFQNAQAAAGDPDLAGDHYLTSARNFQASAVAMPDSSSSYLNWAYALLGSGRDVEAISPLQLALQTGGPDVELYNFLSRIYLTNDRAPEAVPLLEEGVMEFSEDEELQNLLLNAYATTGETERALDMYSNTVANSPSNKVYRYNYGSLLLQSEQYDAAIEQLRAALELDGDYVDALYNLGAAFINKANDLQQAQLALDDTLRARRDSMSEEEATSMEAELTRLNSDRVDLYMEAIGPLEHARALAEADPERRSQEICIALFQAYGQTNQVDKAEGVGVCAGF